MAVVTIQQSVAALYVAVFNRAPDAAGLNAWTAVITSGQQTFAQVAAGFAAHEVFTTGIGTLSNTDFVAALYQNILGSAGDASGIANWSNQLNAGMSKADVAALFVQAALTVDIPAMLAAGSLTAAEAAAATVRQQTLTNKADVGIYFANTLGAASNLNPNTVSSSKAGLEADPIYNASKAAIANVTDSPASVAAAKDAIAVAAGSSNPAQALLGGTFTLTAGADTIVGGAASDVINALTVKADGSDASTLTGFDSIDGGAGNDTLNIYSDGTLNASLPTSATVKNVETINIYNQDAVKAFGAAAGIDASKFVGATAINQIGTVAADVANLAAGTTAGFNGTAGGTLSVTAANAAATANVVLTQVDDVTTLAVKADATAATSALNSVTVSGTRVDADADGVDNLNLTVVAGKDVESVSINTATNTTFTSVTNAGGKTLSTVDASASTGAVTYVGATSVANIKTGAGKDTVTLATSLDATVKAASISTGAGDDTITVAAVVGTAAAGQTVAVDAGDGNDTINLTIASGVTYNVAAGAGDDTVVIAGTVKTTDKIDGGAGTDTVSLALADPKTLVADDYIVFNKVLTNFETLQLTGKAATMDASQLGAGYTAIDLATDSKVINVGAQALVAHGALTAEANGVVFNTAGVEASGVKTYAGSLSITEDAAGTVTAFANSVALSVKAGTVAVASTLAGDVQTAAVSLVNSVDSATAPTADTIASVTVGALVGGTGIVGLTSLTLSGNGSATVFNGVSDKLVTVDASNLGGVYTQGVNKGAAIAGLTYTSANTAAETIKLGAGQDNITLGASTYGKVDVVTGLNLVASAADAKVVDATKSDVLEITGVDLSTTGALGFTTTQTDLDLALKDAATYSKANDNTDVAFHMGGNTYVFHDSVADNGLIDATDTVVQITGQVNLDLLASSLVA